MIRAIILAVFLPCAALAQVPNEPPVCTPALKNTVACKPTAANLQSSDIVSAEQATGPLRSPQSVRVTMQQIMAGNFPGQFSSINASLFPHSATGLASGQVYIDANGLLTKVP